jgi:hypothetical protein
MLYTLVKWRESGRTELIGDNEPLLNFIADKGYGERVYPKFFSSEEILEALLIRDSFLKNTDVSISQYSWNGPDECVCPHCGGMMVMEDWITIFDLPHDFDCPYYKLSEIKRREN